MVSRIKQLRERLGEIVRLPSVILLSTVSLSYSQLEKEIPMMEFLPNGTALTNVSIPSYDDNLKPTSLFKADEVKMIDKKNGIMEATNVRVKIFTEEKPVMLSFNEATYHYNKSFLEAKQRMTINNDTFSIHGTGACYDLESRELFIKGPSRALFLPKELAHRICLGVLSAVALLPAHADPPEAASHEELAKYAEIRNATDSTTESASKRYEEKSAALTAQGIDTDAKVSSFLLKSGQEQLLVKNEVQKKEKAPTVIPANALTMICDDGMYYDAENGHIVCLKNVEVDDPRFSLYCTDQLKVYLSQPVKEEGEVMGIGSSEVKELVATGDVILIYKDGGLQSEVKLTGQSAHIDVIKEEITVDGGLPTMQQGTNFIEALEPTWIKISKKGVRFGPGKKRTVYLPAAEDE